MVNPSTKITPRPSRRNIDYQLRAMGFDYSKRDNQTS